MTGGDFVMSGTGAPAGTLGAGLRAWILRDGSTGVGTDETTTDAGRPFKVTGAVEDFGVRVSLRDGDRRGDMAG